MSARKLDRRSFLRLTTVAGGGLMLGFAVGCERSGGSSAAPPAPALNSLSSFVSIDAQGRIQIIHKKTEMGQGVRTLAMLVAAEELDARLDQISVINPSPSAEYSGMQTGGSYSARYIYNAMRPHFAAIRRMLQQAAAQRWKVPISDCSTELGEVVNTRDGSRVGYGELAEAAAKLDVPQDAPLKAPADFRLLGRSHAHQHNREMLTGTAKYGLDQRVDGMFYACLVRAPVVGGKVRAYDDSGCAQVPGFVRSVQISGTGINSFPEYIRDGVAVIASNSWAAMQAAERLQVDWELGENQQFASSGYMDQLRAMAEGDAKVFRQEGELDRALEEADQVLEASYSGPFMAHAPMEPMNCVAVCSQSRCEVWVPCHAQNRLLDGIKQLTGLDEQAIVIHTCLIGGSFGRRLQVDYALEAVLVAKAIGKPVQLLWSRQEDMKFGCLRSPYVQKMRGAVKGGRIIAFDQQIACSSVWQLREPQMLVDRLDYTVIMPAKILPYGVQNLRMSQAITALPVPQGWWRASYPTIHHTVQECWMDELIHAAAGDPFQMRLDLLADDATPLEFAWQEGWGKDVIDRKRLSRVLRELRAKCGWTRPKGAGEGRGMACSIYSDTYIAQVVELTVVDGQLRLQRVVCAVDCGLVLNPDNVLAQIEGGIIFGLSGALYGQISFADGRVEQSNFNDYRLLTLKQTPPIEVHLVQSDAGVSGVGEPGAHPIMAATCNAVFDACGQRIRDLPIALQLNVA